MKTGKKDMNFILKLCPKNHSGVTFPKSMLNCFILATQGACNICNTYFMQYGIDSRALMKPKPPPFFVFEKRMRFSNALAQLQPSCLPSPQPHLLFRHGTMSELCHIDQRYFATYIRKAFHSSIANPYKKDLTMMLHFKETLVRNHMADALKTTLSKQFTF